MFFPPRIWRSIVSTRRSEQPILRNHALVFGRDDQRRAPISFGYKVERGIEYLRICFTDTSHYLQNGEMFGRVVEAMMSPKARAYRDVWSGYQLFQHQNKWRPCVVVEFAVDPQGAVVGQKIVPSKTLIKDTVSYRSADLLLGTSSYHYRRLLQLMMVVACNYRKIRAADRTFMRSDPETGLYLSEDGLVVKATQKDHYAFYFIINDLRLMAEETVADYAVQHGLSVLYSGNEDTDSLYQRGMIQGRIDQLFEAAQGHDQLEAQTLAVKELLYQSQYSLSPQTHALLGRPYHVHFARVGSNPAAMVTFEAVRQHLHGKQSRFTSDQIEEICRACNARSVKQRANWRKKLELKAAKAKVEVAKGYNAKAVQTAIMYRDFKPGLLKYLALSLEAEQPSVLILAILLLSGEGIDELASLRAQGIQRIADNEGLAAATFAAARNKQLIAEPMISLTTCEYNDKIGVHYMASFKSGGKLYQVVGFTPKERYEIVIRGRLFQEYFGVMEQETIPFDAVTPITAEKAIINWVSRKHTNLSRNWAGQYPGGMILLSTSLSKRTRERMHGFAEYRTTSKGMSGKVCHTTSSLPEYFRVMMQGAQSWKQLEGDAPQLSELQDVLDTFCSEKGQLLFSHIADVNRELPWWLIYYDRKETCWRFYAWMAENGKTKIVFQTEGSSLMQTVDFILDSWKQKASA